MYQKTVASALLFTLFTITVTACNQPMPFPVQPALQAESPLIPEEVLQLTKHPWRVVTIIHQNEIVPFDAIQPIYVKVWPEGGLSAETGCNHLGFGMIAQDEQRYRLAEGNTTQADCPEVQTKQYGGFWTALSNTNRFELQNEQLTLIGDESEIVLEATHPFTLAHPVFTQNRWQLLEITDQGQPVII